MREPACFVERKNAKRGFGRESEISHCAIELPRSLEQKSKLGRGGAGNSAMHAQQCFADCLAQRNTPRNRERCVQRVLIQHVHEAVPPRYLAIRKLALARAAHESVHAIEMLETVLDVGGVGFHRLRDDRRIKAVALNRSRREEIAILNVELSDLALDHAPHRLGDVVIQVRERSRQFPATAWRRNYVAARAKVSKQIFDEQRASFCPGVNEVRESFREPVVRKAIGDEFANRVLGEKHERDLTRRAARLKIELEREERMRRELKLGRPVRRYREQL